MFIAKKIVNLELTVRKALKAVHGIGKARLNFIFKHFNRHGDLGLSDLSRRKRNALSRLANPYASDLELKKAERLILVQHLECGTYKGIRFRQGMPANGQRTRSNASTTRRKFILAKVRGN